MSAVIAELKAGISSDPMVLKRNDFYAVKLFVNNEVLNHEFSDEILWKAAELRTKLETECDDEMDRIITEQRYGWIQSIMPEVVVKHRKNYPCRIKLIAILLIIAGGIFLKHTLLKGEPAPFVMELSEYKMPRPKNIVHFVWEKSIVFFRKADTIIVLTTIVIWFLK